MSQKNQVSLYDIAEEINSIVEMVDEDGVLLPEAEAKFEELIMDKTVKFKNIGGLIKNLTAYADAFKEEKKRLTRHQQIAENKVERLKSYLKFIMQKNGDKVVEAGTFKFSFRSSSSILVDDPTKLPAEFQKITVEAKKIELKEALEGGAVIEGVSVAHGENLVIS